MARSAWFALDVGFLGNNKISEMGAQFGPGGPLCVIAMLAAAKAQDEDGRFTIAYKNLARAAFVSSAKKAREVVARSTQLDVVRMIEMDHFGFTAVMQDWDEWQYGTRKTPGARRTARWREARHGDAPGPSRSNGVGDGHGDGTVTGTYTETYTEKAKAFSSEVVGLCDLLADLIEQNGSKRPTVTTAWKESGRLLLERDGRVFEASERVLRWSQGDEFWRANVLSMPTFRKRYDQLRLAMERSNVTPITAHQRLEDMRRRATEPEDAA